MTDIPLIDEEDVIKPKRSKNDGSSIDNIYKEQYNISEKILDRLTINRPKIGTGKETSYILSNGIAVMVDYSSWYPEHKLFWHGIDKAKCEKYTNKYDKFYVVIKCQFLGIFPIPGNVFIEWFKNFRLSDGSWKFKIVHEGQKSLIKDLNVDIGKYRNSIGVLEDKENMFQELNDKRKEKMTEDEMLDIEKQLGEDTENNKKDKKDKKDEERKTKKIIVTDHLSDVYDAEKILLQDYIVRNKIKLRGKKFLAGYDKDGEIYLPREENSIAHKEDVLVIDISYDKWKKKKGTDHNITEIHAMTDIVRLHKKEKYGNDLWSVLGNRNFTTDDDIGSYIIRDTDICDYPIVLIDYEYNWKKEKNIDNVQIAMVESGTTEDKPKDDKSKDATTKTNVDIEIEELIKKDDFNIAKYFDKQGIALAIHKSIRNTREKDIDNTLDMLSVNDIVESISDEDAIIILNKSVDHIKDKNNKEKSEKDKKDNILKETKKRAEKISMEEYVKMFHERLRQGLIMYNKIDIEFFFSSILSGQWTNLRGVNGIGKDLLLILFGTLSCEDFDEQVLYIPPSLGQEIDDNRILGYQSAITDKYYHSRYMEHVIKANKNPSKLYIIINAEANIVNIDRSYLPISVAIDSAQSKITLPRYQKEGDTHIEEDPKMTSNILIFNTTNDIIRRPEITLKDIDRMSMMNLIDPIIRSTEDRKKLEDKDGKTSYKPIIESEHIFIELCKKYILTSKDRTTNLRDLYYIDNEYRKFEDNYQDNLRDEVNKLNAILRNGHLRNAQMAPRFTESALRFLYVAIEKLKIDPKLAKSQLMLERFIPRIEDVTDQYIDTLDVIKDELIEYLSKDKDADPIKEIDEIIWKLDPHHVPKNK